MTSSTPDCSAIVHAFGNHLKMPEARQCFDYLFRNRRCMRYARFRAR